MSGISPDEELRRALVDRLIRLSELSAALPEERASAALSDYAEGLREPAPHVLQIHENVALLLRAGPGSLSDQYFVRNDGTPDLQLSERFVALIEEARALNRSFQER